MPENRGALSDVLRALLAAHRERFGGIDDLLVGLQLTHSGRFSRPRSKTLEPRIAYHHPLLDVRFGVDPGNDLAVVRDEELYELIECYVSAAGAARDAGFRFVDVKACHGYLVHEFLSAFVRPGPFGGDFAGRTRFLREIVNRIRKAYPELVVGVRLSAFDTVPYEAVRGEAGRPMRHAALLPYRYGFGLDQADPLRIDLSETIELLRILQELGVAAVNISCGTPYYNPHVQRPAIFPPSDGYEAPEDPLVGVARQISVARRCKQSVREMPIVGSGYSYLQDFLPHVAQAIVREGWADIVGLGRMVLAYPEMPADVLASGRLAQANLSNVQRLYNGSAQRAGIRLLSPRQLLQKPAGGHNLAGHQTAKFRQ